MMPCRWLAIGIVVLFALFSSPTAALYTAGSAVVTLDPSNLQAKIKAGPMLVEMFAPWCVLGRRLLP
jgi:protein disulfide-isomerase A6